MERQPEPTTWVHQLQASHPELSVHQIIELAQLALSPGPGEAGGEAGGETGGGGGGGGGAGYTIEQFEPLELETPGAVLPLAAAEAEVEARHEDGRAEETLDVSNVMEDEM